MCIRDRDNSPRDAAGLAFAEIPEEVAAAATAAALQEDAARRMAAREAKKAQAARDDAGALAVFSAQRAAATASSAAPTAASAAGTMAAGSEKGDDPSVASSDLSCSMPVGWKRYAASASGRPYFFNPNTGGTQWEPPVLRYALDDGPVSYTHLTLPTKLEV